MDKCFTGFCKYYLDIFGDALKLIHSSQAHLMLLQFCGEQYQFPECRLVPGK